MEAEPKSDAFVGTLDASSGSRGGHVQDEATEAEPGTAAGALSTPEEAGKPRSRSSEQPTRRRVRKPRKPTSTLRRDEISVLRQQRDRLQARLEGLQQSAAPHAESCGDCMQRIHSNQALRAAVYQQHLVLAGAHAITTEYSHFQPNFPIHRSVHLSRDRASRQETLLAMKPAKLADAHAFLQLRYPRLDPRRKFSDAQQFDMPDGDIIVVFVHMEKLQGARSVKQAYEMMLNQMYNLEMRISDQLGNITIREDDELGEKEFQQMRLVSTTPSNVSLESNLVVFRSYKEHDDVYNGGRECAITTSDFVDEDELYPYRPNDRVRRDVSGIIRLTSHKTGPRDDDVEVMITRYGHMRMRQPKFPVSQEVWKETVASIGRWTEFFMSSINDMLKMQS